jgi:hypothetical protein
MRLNDWQRENLRSNWQDARDQVEFGREEAQAVVVEWREICEKRSRRDTMPVEVVDGEVHFPIKEEVVVKRNENIRTSIAFFYLSPSFSFYPSQDISWCAAKYPVIATTSIF